MYVFLVVYQDPAVVYNINSHRLWLVLIRYSLLAFTMLQQPKGGRRFSEEVLSHESQEPNRTLHSYNSIWVVCHLFPRQRWRTHTYSISGNHWPGEPRDLRKTTSARKFRPAFGATSKTRIFYKYVVFKHSFAFHYSADTLSSV